MNDEQPSAIELTSGIVSAYVGNNVVLAAELPALIQRVHRALKAAASGPAIVETAPQAPAVPVRKSITPEHLICLEDGRKFKSLKRHLRIKYDLTPQAYRAKWNLPKDYPMVAPAYAEVRSDLAKRSGLGQAGRRTKAAAPKKAPRPTKVRA